MKLSIILATLLVTSASFAQSVIDLPVFSVQPPAVEKSVSECSFNPERYREVSFVQDFVLDDGQGNDYVEFKAGQSYHVSGVRIVRLEFFSGSVSEYESVLLAVPGHSVRPMTMQVLDNMSKLRVMAWKALECR